MLDEVCDEVVKLERLADFIARALEVMMGQEIPEGVCVAQSILQKRLAEVGNRLNDLSMDAEMAKSPGVLQREKLAD